MAVQTDPEVEWSIDELAEAAKWQKYLIWVILLQLLAAGTMVVTAIGSQSVGEAGQAAADSTILLLWVLRIVIWAFSIYSVYKMASAVRQQGVVYAVLMLVPLISLFAVLYLNGKVIRILQDNGIRVGLMGANDQDIERLRSQAGPQPYRQP